MASVLDQLDQSDFSLPGNDIDAEPGSSAWGFPDWTYNNGDLGPELSNLHWDYSYLNDPDDVEIQDFNRLAFGGNVYIGLPSPSSLDELDPIAPRNLQVGGGSVVSQIYKSKYGRRYSDLGPSTGRY